MADAHLLGKLALLLRSTRAELAKEREAREKAEAKVDELRTLAKDATDALIADANAALVAERAKAERMEAALVAIKPALPVLRAMCRVADLNAGADKADEMLAWIAEALGDKERFPDPPIDALRALAGKTEGG